MADTRILRRQPDRVDAWSSRKGAPVSKYVLSVLTFIFALALVGCAAPPAKDVSGVVVDAKTGEPVEGAVAIAEWNVTKGVGHTYHDVVKVEEVVTGKDGRFFISAPTKGPFNKPYVVVYKPGYVAWRNDDIFPSWEKRKDFKFGRDVKIELEEFKEGYSREQHHVFMGSGFIGASFNKVPVFSEYKNVELGKSLMEIKVRKMKAKEKEEKNK